jgi:uncharacterized protein DUF2441
MLEPGSVILPGNWGRILNAAGWSHNQALRETVFEHVRLHEFPDKPSRLDALFFFDDENEARFYASSGGREFTMLPYEIELVNPDAPKHVSDWRGLQPRTPLLDLSWVRDYWAGQMLPPHVEPLWTAKCREVLAVTPGRIIRRL